MRIDDIRVARDCILVEFRDFEGCRTTSCLYDGYLEIRVRYKRDIETFSLRDIVRRGRSCLAPDTDLITDRSSDGEHRYTLDTSQKSRGRCCSCGELESSEFLGNSCSDSRYRHRKNVKIKS